MSGITSARRGRELVALNEKLTALRHEERRAALPVRRHEEEEAQGDAAVAVRGLHDAVRCSSDGAWKPHSSRRVP